MEINSVQKIYHLDRNGFWRESEGIIIRHVKHLDDEVQVAHAKLYNGHIVTIHRVFVDRENYFIGTSMYRIKPSSFNIDPDVSGLKYAYVGRPTLIHINRTRQ